MPGRSDLMERAARGAAAGMSRRDLVRLGAGAAAAAYLPAFPTRAQAEKTRGTCGPVEAGTCPDGLKPGRWTPAATVVVPNGTPSTYNGCGPEAGVKLGPLPALDLVPDNPLLLGEFFESCGYHDCCYGACGSDKARCDREFLLLMVRSCARKHDGRDPSDLLGRLNCGKLAEIYYSVVAGPDGKGAWESAQETACFSCERCDADLLTDPANCGTCGHQCPPGHICCGGECKNPDVDNANCGTCGTVCKEGQRCIGRVCNGCRSGEIPCNGTCCPDGRPCVDGQCGKFCEGKVPCGKDQECCVAPDGSGASICCPKGTTCRFSISGTAECRPI